MNLKKTLSFSLIIFTYGINAENLKEQKFTRWIAASLLKTKQSNQGKNEWVDNGNIQHFMAEIKDLDGNKLIRIRTKFDPKKANYALNEGDYTPGVALDKEIAKVLLQEKPYINQFYSLDKFTRCRYVVRNDELSDCECVTIIPHDYAQQLGLIENATVSKE